MIDVKNIRAKTESEIWQDLIHKHYNENPLIKQVLDRCYDANVPPFHAMACIVEVLAESNNKKEEIIMQYMAKYGNDIIHEMEDKE